MKKLLSYSAFMMLATMVLTSCGQRQQAETEKEVPLKVTYAIECSRDLLNLCDLVITYKGDDGVNVVDTITANPSPDSPSETQTWTKTVGTHKIPVKIGFDYTLVQKTDTLLVDGKYARLTAKGSIIAEKIGIREGIAHLSEKTINSNTNFFKDFFIMAEDVINSRHNLATIIDIFNDRQAYYRRAIGSNTCYVVTPSSHGKGLKVEKASWDGDISKASSDNQVERQ